MNYILFDDHTWQNLLPLTFTKPVAEEEWPIILRTTQTAVSSPFIEQQAIAGTELHRKFSKESFCRLFAK